MSKGKLDALHFHVQLKLKRQDTASFLKKSYIHLERQFEKLTFLATAILGNSLTFIAALGTVIYWLCNREFHTQGVHASIGDVILGVTFLSMFIIQKSFNRFSAVLHLKVNELIASHEAANNSVMNLREKTEREITELTLEYAELDERFAEEE